MNNLILPISICFSWAWAGSLLVGPALLTNQGIEAFLVWAVANCLTLTLFGQLYKRNIITEDIIKHKAIHGAMLFIQMLCLIVQLAGLYTCLSKFCDPFVSNLVSISLGCIFILGMYSKGLKASIITDNFQGLATMLGLVLIIGVFLFTDAPVKEISHSTPESLMFGSWTACILLSGIITDLQYWQRAKVMENRYTFEIASVLFACYIALIAWMGLYEHTQVTNAILLVVMMCVTTSTIDSAAVALHTCVNKKVGTLIGLAICALFPVFTKVGFVSLWANLGVFRVALALTILGCGIYAMVRGVDKTEKVC